MTPGLEKYLELERLMSVLDEDGDPVAETLRDAMDPIWYSLTDAERLQLDDRRMGRVTSLEEIRVPVGSQVFVNAPAPPEPRALPPGLIHDWDLAPAA
jgi:hypothetical protein